MDLVSGYTNFSHDCGCPAEAVDAVYVLTTIVVEEIFTEQWAYVYDPTDWSLMASFLCPTNSRGLVFVEDQACAFYHNRISFINIDKWDHLLRNPINGASIDFAGLLLHPDSGVAEIGMYGMTSDGTDIWVMGSNTSAGAQAVYKVSTAGALITSYTIGDEVRCHPMEWYDGKIIAARYDNEGGSLVTSNQSNIFDVYDADTGASILPGLIDTTGLHTIQGVTGHAWGIMLYNGDFYIGDRWGERLLQFNTAGGFMGNIPLTGLASDSQILTIELGKYMLR